MKISVRVALAGVGAGLILAGAGIVTAAYAGPALPQQLSPTPTQTPNPTPSSQPSGGMSPHDFSWQNTSPIPT
jgi:hypothetical protein